MCVYGVNSETVEEDATTAGYTFNVACILTALAELHEHTMHDSYVIMWMYSLRKRHFDEMSLRITPSKFFFLLIITSILFLLFYIIWSHRRHCNADFYDYYEGKPLVIEMDKESRERLNQRAFTQHLWNFEGKDTEKLYLYHKLLQKNHSFNKTNIDLIRQEVDNELGRNISELFILDQKNTAVGSKLHYNMKTSRKSHFLVTEDFRKHLLPNVTFKRYKRCSVVGNSGTLLRSKCGRQIDSSDFVFRCNAAPVQTFQEDTGRKSNVTSFNPSILRLRYKGLSTQGEISNLLQDMKEFSGFLLASCFSTSGYIDLCLKMLKNYNITENHLAMGHPDHFQKYCNFWSKRGLSRRLTTGFYFTNVALRYCDEVHLYGFWPFPFVIDASLMEVPYHYFDDMKFDFQIKDRNVHFMDVEFSFFVQLHLHGLIKLHVGECDHR